MALRVLIVDDSETTRRILCNIIRAHYWDVCGEVENGWSGVTKTNSRRIRPNCSTKSYSRFWTPRESKTLREALVFARSFPRPRSGNF